MVLSSFKEKKIGIYGGTFDPIHHGHLHAAIEIYEKAQLDEVWFVPASSSPFKNDQKVTSYAHRYQMLQLAIQGIPYFRLCDIENKREGPSYTVDTIREILENNSSQANRDRYFLMIGDDMIKNFHLWHQVEELVSLVPLLIATRLKSNEYDCPQAPPQVREAIKKGLITTPVMEISATDLRKRLKDRLYCGHLIPTKVLDYIYQNQLYYYW